MKFFESIKQAAFSVKLFAAAGLADLFATAFKADNANALKDHLESLAKGKAAAEVETALAEATAENATLSTNLAAAIGAKSTAEAALATAQATSAQSAEKLTALSATLKTSGIDLAACAAADGTVDPAKFSAALKSAASLKASELLARTGGQPLEETPAAGVTDPKKPAAHLTGRARTIAAFKAQSDAKSAGAR